LSARIDRLPDDAKTVLQTAAVLGKRFSASLLQRVFDALGDAAGRAAIGSLLDDLTVHELVGPTGYRPGDEYEFKHPLTHDVAYRTQLAGARARTHAATAEVLAAVHSNRLDEHAAVLAHHWESAGEALHAARWHRRAAEWIGKKDRREATRHWKTVCALLDSLPLTPETAQLGALARHRRLYNAVYLGQPEDEQHALYREGRAMAAAHGGAGQVVQLSIGYGVARVFAGAVHEGVREIREAIRLADESGDRTLRCVARASIVNPLHFAGELREALTWADEALALSDGNPRFGLDLLGFSPHLVAMLARIVVLLRTGALADAARWLTRARDTALALQDVEAIGTSHVFAVILADLSGDTDAALDHARTAVALAERRGSPFFRAGAQTTLGQAHFFTGQWAEAAAALEGGLAIVAERRTGLQLEPTWMARLAEAYLELGDSARAVATAERALMLARQRGTEVWRIDALLALARIRRRVDGRAAADAVGALLDDAGAAVAAIGARSMTPLVDVELAELALVRGDDDAAAAALARARAGFLAIGAIRLAARVARRHGHSSERRDERSDA
jgi:tetratricopeptide (TPR) repeat protein